MGLDTVELLMDVETVFDVALGDDDAAQVLTVDDLYGLILSKRHLQRATPEAADVWERLCTLIADRAGIPREQVVPTARITRDLGLN